MAVFWYCQRPDGEVGPVTFRTLVQMVGNQELRESDLVCAHFDRRWRRADEVVGLFYVACRMARDASRRDAGTHAAADRSESVSTEDVFPAARMFSLETQLTAERNNFVRPDSLDEYSPTRPNGEIALALEKALATIDRRSQKPKLQPWQVVVGSSMRRVQAARRCLKRFPEIIGWGGAVVAAFLALFFVRGWEAGETVRFPGLLDQQSLRAFPLVGVCPPAHYWFFLGDFMLLAGIAGFFGASWVENQLN
jgi:hypothetical protein